MDEMEEIQAPSLKRTVAEKKSMIVKYFPLLAQMVAVYGSLKLSKLLIQSMQLPNKNLQLCILSAFASYGSQKVFNAFKWEYTLLLFTKLCCEITVNTLPQKLKILSLSKTYLLICTFWSYQLIVAAQHASKSYLHFYKTCYGFGAKDESVRILPDALAKYHEAIENDPDCISCRDYLHLNTPSCAQSIARRTAHHSKCMLQWYFKFYLIVSLLFASPSIIKRLSLSKLMNITKKAATSAIRSTSSSVIMVLLNYYIAPCVSQYIFRTYFPNKMTIIKQKFISILFALLSIKTCYFVDSPSRRIPLMIFCICQLIQHRVNKIYDINNMKDGKSKHSVIVRDNNFTSGFVAAYMLMTMTFCWWSIRKNKTLKGFDTKIFQRFMFS